MKSVLFALLAFGTTAASAANVLELSNFTLIDGTGAVARPVKTLVARDGVIVSIDGEAYARQKRDRVTQIDLDGAHVIPGLIDTHVHVARFPETRGRAERILRGAVRGGITAVRDLTGDARTLADVERAIAAREFIGPTVIYSAMFGGPDIYKAGPTASMSPGREPGTAPWTRVVDARSDLPTLVAQAVGTGAKNAKVYGDLDDALATNVIREARRQGLLVTAHGTVFPARPSTLVAAGAGSLSHAPYLVWEAAEVVPDDYQMRTQGAWTTVKADHPKLRALYAQMAKEGATLDATLYIFRKMQSFPPERKVQWSKDAFAWAVEATKLAHRAGVRVTTGTDWFEPEDELGLPHTHEELAILVESVGFTPMEAIVAGTRHGAIALGLEKTHGTIEPGKFADLVVLDADPLADIRNTTAIRFVVRHGDVVDPVF